MIWKLKEQGPLTMTVGEVEVVESTKFIGTFQSKFTDVDGENILYMGKPAAARQLARLGLTEETVVGKTVRFSQTEKDGTTFTNMALATPGSKTGGEAAPTAAAGATPTSNKMDPKDAGKLYGECLSQAILVFGTQCEELGIAMDAQALHAVAATIFIKVSR